KDVLLVDAYGEFRADLRDLSQKHPSTAEDVALLIEKYTLTASGKTLDVGLLNAEFKAIEQKRKLLQEELRKIDVQKSAYEISETRRAALIEQGSRYHEQYDVLAAKNAEVNALGTQADLEKRLQALQTEKKAAQNKVDDALKAWNGYLAEKQAQETLAQRCKDAEKGLLDALERAVQESGFATATDAIALIETLDDEQIENCRAFFEKYAVVKSKYDETDKTKFADFDETAAARALAQKQENADEYTQLTKRLATLETELNNLLALRERNRALAEKLQEKQKRMDLCEELRNLLKSNRFLGFIASEYLQEICISASGQLRKLTAGRYFLHYDEEFKVGDNLDGGNFRAVKTLSGGETFLVSLSLALSLSQAICQKSMRPIEFFFLDEGFGTLDDKLVNVVMDVLGRLSKDFAVGLISHVEELKHRIDNKILVSGATETHGSRVRMERF
ncbi:MAG: SMC family ATPase, partial [Clostridia bacterium]|nr:SMC family ATPase [Clostridia bacterium]